MKLRDELQTIKDKLDNHNLILERLTVTVEHHVKRTDLLEERMTPIEDHVKFVNKLCKFVTGLIVASAGMAGVARYFIER